MEHIALVTFSICLQAAIGIMLFVAIGKLINKEGVFKKAIILAAVLSIVGLLASLLHLGHPFSAINSLKQFGTSWLSREIWFSALFAGVTVVSAILVLLKPAMRSAVTGLAALAAIVGLVDVYAMASIYNYASVPAWQSIATYVEFYAAMLTAGGVLFLLVSGGEAASTKKIVGILIAAAIAVQAASMGVYFTQLGGAAGAAASESLAILSAMSAVTVAKWLFLVLGAVLLWLPVKDPVKMASAALVAGAVLLVVGQVLGRYLFYAAMVVTRVGLS